MNIPIFRAKKIGSEEYIIGYLKFDRRHNHYSINPIDDDNTWHKIKENTLAIHFPNMTDIKGDKIFASLQDDGKGGDCTFMQNGYNEVFCWDTLNACVVLKSKHYECKCFRNGNRNETTFNTYTIVGILQ